MKKSKKVKYLPLPMEFNIAWEKYEPAIPSKLTHKKLKVRVNWKWVAIYFFIALVMVGIAFTIGMFL